MAERKSGMTRRQFLIGAGAIGVATVSGTLIKYFVQDVPPEQVPNQVLVPTRVATPVNESDAFPSPLRQQAAALYDLSPAVSENPTPDRFQTSEFIAGRIVYQTIVLQSDPARTQKTEPNMTPTQLQALEIEVEASANWWEQKAPPEANVSIKVNDIKVMSVGIEAINHPIDAQGIGIGEAMTKLGIPGADYFEQVHNYNDKLRKEAGADWAITLFIIPSFNDPDDKFAPDATGRTRAAIAYMQGPFLEAPTGVGGFGFENLDAVLAHEEGHALGGLLDQYPSALVDCNEQAGYLRGRTGNSKAKHCDTNDPSIMDEILGPYNNHQLDGFGEIQAGWQRQNVQGQFPLVIGGRVEQNLQMHGNVLTGTIKINYPLPGPGERPVNINRFTEAFVIVNGQRINLVASDGAIDEYQEDVHATVPLSIDGNAQVGLKGYIGGTAYIPMNVPMGDFPKVFLPMVPR